VMTTTNSLTCPRQPRAGLRDGDDPLHIVDISPASLALRSLTTAADQRRPDEEEVHSFRVVEGVAVSVARTACGRCSWRDRHRAGEAIVTLRTASVRVVNARRWHAAAHSAAAPQLENAHVRASRH